jgi:hypothetical protein
MIFKLKNILLLILFSLILPVESCIEPITPELNENDSESVMVVEGQITNEEGPFKVKLTISVPVDVMYYPTPVTDAEVHILDDHGNSYQLFGDVNGWYETENKNLRGIPGNSYTLSITTKEGMQYESSSVLMEDVADIDSVYYEQVKHTRFGDDKTYEDNWLNILIDTHDSESKTKYWFFGYEETWEVRMLTDYIMVEHSPPGSPDDFSWERIDIQDDKSVCWVTRPSNSIILASTANSPVNDIKRLRVQSLGPGEDKLHIRYSILVKQSAISRELYDYWKQLMDVNENVGGIFDKIPAQIYGNISCCDSSSRVLGYFSAISVKEKRIFIDKSEHMVETGSAYNGCYYYDYEQLPWIPKSYFGTISGKDTRVYCNADYCSDCRFYGTNIRPDFWN